MKALSLWQPWATLVAIGAKQVETRSWYTSYRGPLVICASKKWNWDLYNLCLETEFYDALKVSVCGNGCSRAVPTPLPLGVALARVTLVDCLRTDVFVRRYPLLATDQELRFGDYTHGRYAWVFEDIQPFVSPPPLRGAQGLFEIDAATVEAAATRLEAKRKEAEKGTP